MAYDILKGIKIRGQRYDNSVRNVTREVLDFDPGHHVYLPEYRIDLFIEDSNEPIFTTRINAFTDCCANGLNAMDVAFQRYIGAGDFSGVPGHMRPLFELYAREKRKNIHWRNKTLRFLPERVNQRLDDLTFVLTKDKRDI